MGENPVWSFSCTDRPSHSALWPCGHRVPSTAALLSPTQAMEAYVNVHDVMNPDGVARGQVQLM